MERLSRGAGARLGVAAVCAALAVAGSAQAFLRPVPGAKPAAPAGGERAKEEPRAVRRPSDALPDQNKFYDPANPDYKAIQKANESLAGLPIDRQGYIDWMYAIKNGIITPRADVKGETTVQPLDLDVIMADTKEMPYVLFPHRAHTMWLDCSNCHPAIFEPKAGANPVSMAEIFRGRYCGVCHDRVAFITFFSCDRCHRVPNPAMQNQP